MVREGVVYECLQQLVLKKCPNMGVRRRLLTDELEAHFASVGAFTSDHQGLVHFDAFGFAYNRVRDKDKVALLGAKFTFDEGDQCWHWKDMTLNDRAEVLTYVERMSDVLLHFFYDLAFADDFVACYIDKLKQAEIDAVKRFKGVV